MSKILIVDDSQADLKNLERIVAAENYQIVKASSGTEAIVKAKLEKPDLILMDIIMEDMDGFNACRELSKDPALADIPVVFVSSKNQKADHMWAVKQGAKGLISKPYEDDQIIEQIKKYAA